MIHRPAMRVLSPRHRHARFVAVLAAAVLAAACVHDPVTSPCEALDPVLAESSFVLVTDPRPGARVSSPLQVRGCSRTFESTVVWELHSRGEILASGHATGGGHAGPAAFGFSVPFRIPASRPGHLHVFAVDASGGEGFPPGRSVYPLVLRAQVD